MIKMYRFGKMNIDYSFKIRVFIIILILFVLFLICGFFYIVIRFYLFFSGYVDLLFYVVDVVVIFVVYLNFVFKFIIYYIRINKFREVCVDIMLFWCYVLYCLLGRIIRRIRLYVVYEVDKKFVILFLIKIWKCLL